MAYLVASVGLMIIGIHSGMTAWNGRHRRDRDGFLVGLALVYVAIALNGTMFFAATLLVFTSETVPQVIVYLLVGLLCATVGSLFTVRAIRRFDDRYLR